MAGHSKRRPAPFRQIRPRLKQSHSWRTFLQELVFDSPEFHTAFRNYAASVADDPTKLLQWAKDYHAGRVAFLMVRGWNGSPIKIMANGDMNDGQHRLLAAVFMDLKEVDVVVLHAEPVAALALPSP